MERFACESFLSVMWEPSHNSVQIKYHHKFHARYEQAALSPDVLEYIANRSLTSTAAEIYRDLRAQRIPGWNDTLQHQVYYRWQMSNMRTWRRDEDPFASAQKLLEEMDGFITQVFVSDNVRAVAIYVRANIEQLSHRALELVMDETYGTNSSGNGLFAVMAEVDGSGIVLAYLLADIIPGDDGKKHSNPGAMINLLQQFLARLRHFGFAPAFFGCDKDMSEIAAIGYAFPESSRQLCYWHAIRAIKKKLTDSDKTASQSYYHPAEAQAIIPNLEVCWGSKPIRRPDGAHRHGICHCPSRNMQFDTKDRIETRTKTERETVLNMFRRHFNQHPLIPNQNGIYRSREAIHQECAQEMYAWCHEKNYYRLFSYLWNNWYKAEMWKLWARASSEEVPVLKTTMILESHWRVIKHDFLHRFNRPRIDLVVWVLTTRVIPHHTTRLREILSRPPLLPGQQLTRQHRIGATDWRKKFRSTWTELASKEVDRESLQHYHTNPITWACACPAFLISRFLICKHIVHCFRPVQKLFRFSLDIRRQRTAPFWVSNYLIIRDELRDLWTREDMDHSDSDQSSSDPEGNIMIADPDESDSLGEEEQQEDPQQFLGTMEGLLETFREQLDRGNTNYIQSFMAANRRNQELADQLQAVRRQRTMPRTWQARMHPSAMYYR